MDEPGLFVFASVEEAERVIEYQDAGEIRAAFDENAIPFQVEWLSIGPPSQAPLLGTGWTELDSGPAVVVDSSSEANSYRLTPSGPPDPSGLTALIEAYPSNATPPDRGKDLAALRDWLSSEG